MNLCFLPKIDRIIRKKKTYKTKHNGSFVENLTRLSLKKRIKSIVNLNTYRIITQSENCFQLSIQPQNISQSCFQPCPSSDMLKDQDSKYCIHASALIESKGKKIKNPMLQKRFYYTREHIEQKLQERNYVLTQCRTEGRDGIIFDRFLQSQNGLNNNLIFNVIFDKKEVNYYDEIEIMIQFEKQRYVINLKERIEGVEDEVCGHFLEKFYDSLSDWSNLIKQNYIVVTSEPIFSFVFNLLGSLPKMKAYKIYNLDMQPANILIALPGSIIHGWDHIKHNQFDLPLDSESLQFSEKISKNSKHSITQFFNNISYYSFEQANLLKVKYYSGLIQKLQLNYSLEMILQIIQNGDNQQDKQTTQNIQIMTPIFKIFRNKQRTRNDTEQLFESTIARKITTEEGFQIQQQCRDENYYKTEQADSQINESLFKGISTQTQVIQNISRNLLIEKIINNISQDSKDWEHSLKEQVTLEKEEVEIFNYKIVEEQCEDKPIQSELPYQYISHQSQKTSTETMVVLSPTQNQQIQEQHLKEDIKKIYLDIQESPEFGKKQIYKTYLKQHNNKNELETIVFSSLTNIQSWNSNDNQINITFNFQSSVEDEMALQRFRQQDFKLSSGQPVNNYDLKIVTTLSNNEISNLGQSYKLTIHKKYMRCQIPKQMKIELQYSQQQQLYPISTQQLSDNKQKQKRINALPQETQQENEIKQIQDPYLHDKFNQKIDIIEKKLEEKGYFLTKYRTEGAEGIIFDGYKKLEEGQDNNLVFKVILGQSKTNYIEEIEIMRRFEQHIHIIDLKDSIECLENEVYVLVLEKCKFSLLDWLRQVQAKQVVVTPEELITLIFQLMDGLIQLRVYKILHLDIKPGNILFSQNGSIIYSDFGISMKYASEFKIKGYTKYYAPREQQDNGKCGKDIDYTADVYSLGKTFDLILSTCEKADYLTQEMKDLIELFRSITINYMIIEDPSGRMDCLQLHQKVFESFQQDQLQKYPNFLQKYQEQLLKISKLEIFDSNKDVPYYLELKRYYLLKLLYIQNLIHNMNDHVDIALTLEMMGVVQCDLGDIYSGVDYEQQSLKMRKSLLKQQNLPSNILQKVEIDIITTINSIGVSYLRLGKFQLALKFLYYSLEQRREKQKTNILGIVRPLNNIGCIYCRLGDYFLALQFKLESLELRLNLLSENHQSVAMALNSVGIGYSKIGDIQNSFMYLYEAYYMRRQFHGDKHPEISQSLHCIGISFGMLGDYQTNLEYQIDALKMRRFNYKGNHPDIADSLHNVAVCYNELGEFQIALKYAFDSLLMNKALNFNSQNTISYELAENLEVISSIYNEMGDCEIALIYGKESLQIKKVIFEGDNNPEVSKALNCIGNIYKKLENFQEAIDYFSQSLQLRLISFQGTNHPLVAQSLFNIGTCYQALLNYEKALDYFKQSLEMRIKMYTFYTYPDLGRSYYEIGCTYHQSSYSLLNNVKEMKLQKMKAKLNILISYKIWNKYFKGVHHLIAKSLNRLGVICTELEKLQKALEYFLKSLEMRELLYKGATHTDVIESLDNLGCCYYKLRDVENAIKYKLRCLEMKKQLFGKYHESVDDSLNCLATYYGEIKDYQNELKYYQESIEIKRIIYTNTHPNIADCLDNIGWAYIKLSQLDIALNYFEEAFSLRQILFNKDSPSFIQSWNNIGYCLYEQGDHQKAKQYFQLILMCQNTEGIISQKKNLEQISYYQQPVQ